MRSPERRRNLDGRVVVEEGNALGECGLFRCSGRRRGGFELECDDSIAHAISGVVDDHESNGDFVGDGLQKRLER